MKKITNNVITNKGQTTILGLMLWVFVIIFSIIIIPSLKDLISTARSVPYLDCSNTTISIGQSATCIVVDLYLPYFIAFIFVAGSALIGFSYYRNSGG